MRFTKMHGAGNDFVIINNMEEKIAAEEFSSLAFSLCRRKFSVGADGLMVVEAPQQGGDYRMLFFNSDGSTGEMCGNGARCIARYGYENGLAGETQKIETVSGMVSGRRISSEQYQIRLNDPTVVDLDRRVDIDGVEYVCSYVELGTPGLPHVVIEYPGLESADEKKLRQLGSRLRHYEAFPKGANVNFYDIRNESIIEKTFERGVEDFTMACGTGSGATALVLTLKGKVSGKDVCISVPGGELFIDVEIHEERVKNLYLTGSAVMVFLGNTGLL